MRKKEAKSNKKMKTKIVVGLIILLIVALGAILGFKVLQDKNQEPNIQQAEFELEPEIIEAEKKVEIFNGNKRPFAVMIDNHNGAWPQAGLDKAYIVYEIIVEGGETRLMALFKDVSVANIGPCRSSRHYFLDYALENDAIYVHYGWSPQAENDVSKLKVNNINGMSESSKDFWRTNKKSSPHDVIVSMESLLKIAEKKGYSLTSTKPSILKYSVEPVELTDGEVAENITIPYSTLQKVTYEYDAENKVYKRSARGKVQNEMDSGKQLTTKNIIITSVKNSTLNDGENKGRQTLNNIGTFDGYYITNGKAIAIKCEKSSRNEQTVYKDLKGNIIDVNDGNTYIHIIPNDMKVTIK